VDTEETELLAGSLRELFADASADVPRRLRELGWDDVAAEHPAEAATLLFTEKGRALSNAALLDERVLPALIADLPGGADAVCYPYPGSGSRPSSTAQQTTGILLRPPRPDERIAIPVADADGITLAAGPVSEFTVTPLPTLDREIGWYALAGATPALRYDGRGWAAGLAAAHRALGAEIIAVAERALDLAVEHTGSRRQFGAPIAAFQAVRHRLADAYVAIAAARALLDASFADGSAVAAMAAKGRAGRAHELVSATAIQVCGAMGATLEHPLHRYVNRGAVLDALLGSSAELTAELGSLIRVAVTSAREIPLLVEV
jgi:hypothetical protein